MSTDPSPIAQAVQLMLAGMGTVFAFLLVLVLATRLLSYLVRLFWTEPEGIAHSAADVTAEELAAAAAAVQRYRQDH